MYLLRKYNKQKVLYPTALPQIILKEEKALHQIEIQIRRIKNVKKGQIREND